MSLWFLLQFPPNSSPPLSSTPKSPWSEDFNNELRNLHHSYSPPLERNGRFRINRRRSNDQHKSERRNTFIVNLNGFKNGFRPRNIGTRFFSPTRPPSTQTQEFSPKYAAPSNLISGTSWTSTNGFHLTSHHQLNNANLIATPDGENKDEDPNKIVEVESDDSPPYMPAAVRGQSPSTLTPQPSPTAPPLERKQSFTQVDLHQQEEHTACQFRLKSSHDAEVSC